MSLPLKIGMFGGGTVGGGEREREIRGTGNMLQVQAAKRQNLVRIKR